MLEPRDLQQRIEDLRIDPTNHTFYIARVQQAGRPSTPVYIGLSKAQAEEALNKNPGVERTLTTYKLNFLTDSIDSLGTAKEMWSSSGDMNTTVGSISYDDMEIIAMLYELFSEGLKKADLSRFLD